jgi:hypothetical protein
MTGRMDIERNARSYKLKQKHKNQMGRNETADS